MTAALGNTAVDTSPADDVGKRRDRQRKRYTAAEWLRAFNGWMFTGERLGQCGWRRNARPGLKQRPDGRVHWTGVKTCGSVWACLFCAAKIRAARASEIDHLIRAHLAAGGYCTMLTFTLPHYASDDLGDLYEAMTKVWESLTSGAGYQKLRNQYGILGTIKAIEVTFGFNGWHPHLHVLFFHDTILRDDDGTLDEFRGRLGDRWGRFIQRRIGRDIHGIFGVDATNITVEDDSIGGYLNKIHFELARSDLKQAKGDNGRTPWQIGVDAAETGDAQDAARWADYVAVTHRRRAISISKAIRDEYPKHETADLTDEELAQQEQEGEVLVDLDNDVYDAVLHHRGQPLRALLATALEDRGIDGVLAELRGAFDTPVYLGRGDTANGETARIIRFVSPQARTPLAPRKKDSCE